VIPQGQYYVVEKRKILHCRELNLGRSARSPSLYRLLYLWKCPVFGGGGTSSHTEHTDALRKLTVSEGEGGAILKSVVFWEKALVRQLLKHPVHRLLTARSSLLLFT
jgi:hypothetical protein